MRVVGRSIVQNHVRQQFRSDGELSVVIDQPHLPELVHELGDPRTSRTHHFSQRFVAQQGNSLIRQSVVLAQSSQLQKDARQPFFTVIEKLIAEVFLEVDVAYQKGRDEFLAPLAGSRGRASSRAFRLEITLSTRGLSPY
jgi:hypothetical protein